MGDKVKKIIKGILGPVLLAIMIGFVLGRYAFKMYKNDLYHELSSSKLYLLENGEYNSIDEMREKNNKNNYVYYKDNDKYKTVVGITNNYNNIDKIKRLYSDKLEVYEYYVSDDLLDRRQLEYDSELSKTDNLEEVKEVVDNILELYRDNDNIRLIQVN